MRGCPEIIQAGSVYLLDDFTYAQVTAVTAGRIRLKLRDGAAWSDRWSARRGLAPDTFRRRVRAQVDAAFFPHLAGGSPRLPHSSAEEAELQAPLRDTGRARSFAAPETDDV